jgi:hypothetical protein
MQLTPEKFFLEKKIFMASYKASEDRHVGACGVKLETQKHSNQTRGSLVRIEAIKQGG